MSCHLARSTTTEKVALLRDLESRHRRDRCEARHVARHPFFQAVFSDSCASRILPCRASDSARNAYKPKCLPPLFSYVSSMRSNLRRISAALALSPPPCKFDARANQRRRIFKSNLAAVEHVRGRQRQDALGMRERCARRGRIAADVAAVGRARRIRRRSPALSGHAAVRQPGLDRVASSFDVDDRPTPAPRRRSCRRRAARAIPRAPRRPSP